MFCILFYIISVDVVGRLTNGVAYLLMKGGSKDAWQLIHMHPLGRALMVGLLAGFVPSKIWLAASGFINSRYPRLLRRLNPDSLKRWMFAFFSPVMFLAVAGWVIDWLALRNQHSSALQTASPYPLATIFQGFLSTNCSDAFDWRVELWGDRFAFDCLIHVQLISIWTLTIGYSLAPFARKWASPLFRRADPEPANESAEENLPESTITVKTITR